MLKGRLGLESARIAQADRLGLIWLGRGKLTVEDGCLNFTTGGSGVLRAGSYQIPFQRVSCILLGPGTLVSHDALRLLARHGTGLVAVGEDGVRLYASMPFGPNDSELARAQVRAWANPDRRIEVVLKMYEWRLGERLPQRELGPLRGIEGTRMKECYRLAAARFGIPWKGRKYDRSDPDSADLPNQALNHAATALEAAAMVATAVSGAIPQLGFIHEDAGQAFCLDIADLHRDRVTIPCAFAAAKQVLNEPSALERVVRRMCAEAIRRDKVVATMIEQIKQLLLPNENDDVLHAHRDP